MTDLPSWRQKGTETMKLFSQKDKPHSEVAVTGVPRLYNNVFCSEGAAPESFIAQKQLYGSLRKSVPVIDGAISKIVRLTGGFSVECNDENARRMLEGFLENVSVGGNMTGIEAFIMLFLDELLTYGTAAGEMVMNRDNRSFSLFNGELDNIVLSRSKNNPMQINISTVSGNSCIPVKNDGRILLGVLDPDAGALHGNSLLRGLPFVSAVLIQIFEATGNNWARMGNLRYSVTYKPQNDAIDKAYAAVKEVGFEKMHCRSDIGKKLRKAQ